MSKQEVIPEERVITIRQELVSILGNGELTASGLSKMIGKSERELYDHLQRLFESRSIKIIPAECLKCGYVFRDRKKVKKPGKCPKCKGTYIQPPLFYAV